jgi:hypothetical protein
LILERLNGELSLYSGRLYTPNPTTHPKEKQ